MKIRLLLWVFFSIPLLFFAQGESNNWYFGEGAGIRFNPDGSVEALNDGALNSLEGCASISSSEGDLLFYTEGTTVYDRTHDIMQNGTGLFGNVGSTQSAIIVPRPGSDNLYYIVTADAFTGINTDSGLNYSIVDMSFNNGNGAVIEKNINLLGDCSEKLTAVTSDCAGESIWVIAFSSEDGNSRPYNTYHAFEINASGISNVPVTSTFNSITILDDRGYMKLSPDGTKLAAANADDGLFLYDFDSTSGIVSNQVELIINAGPNTDSYGVEFSPSSRYLYVHSANNRDAFDLQTSSLLQYDTGAADVSASQIIIEDRDIFRGALQLGPNGKIYRTLSDNFETGRPFLGVINNPDVAGLACDYEHNAVSLNGNVGVQGLPPFVQSFFTSIELTEEEDVIVEDRLQVCVESTLLLEAQPIPGATYVWRKDGIVLNNPTGNFFQVSSAQVVDAGLYTVTITKPGAEACPITGEIVVEIQNAPEINLNTWVFCDTDDDPSDGITLLDLTSQENEDFTFTYYNNQEDLNNEIEIETPSEYTITNPFEQTIFYRVTNDAGCQNNGELTIIVNSPPLIDLEDQVLCQNDIPLSLEGPLGYDFYQWEKFEDGEEEIVSQTINAEITEPGNYTLEVGLSTTINGVVSTCYGLTDFVVRLSGTASISDVIVTGIGNEKTVQIQVTGEGDYEYAIDDSGFRDSNVFEGLSAGFITIFVRDKQGCGITEQTIEIEEDAKGGFMDFFTPNGDGINDYWQFIPPVSGEVDFEVIYVFNRYGQLIVKIDPLSIGWNGVFNGKELPPSDYWYRAVSFNGQSVTGHFSLKR
ncbi:T9SS type B sorting domain-containing protein [Maribacter sp. 2-571]|uniref:T9SS type B sorting domain-containing protein n=1 Tax=Maribacter sp. 2-571 TaxID=3417569 RepID=UPI003D328024